MAIEATAVRPLWDVCDAWLRRAEEVIGASAEALNTLNVFPVSDADTGTNLRLTLTGIARAVPTFDRASLDAVVQAAILSAHGSSGAILAEMVTSLCRALQQPDDRDVAAGAGATVAVLLGRVAAGATRAVAEPVPGTILTVADRAATAAARTAVSHPDDALAVALAARQAAREALVRTPEQLEVLAEAGVVDAGGQAFVLLVDVLVEVLGGPHAEPLVDVTAPLPPSTRIPESAPSSARRPSPGGFEVMYALRGAGRTSLAALRSRLSELGDSVVVVGDQTLAQVHVHLDEPAAAVAAGRAVGRPSRVRITPLPPVAGPGQRSVLSLVVGDGLAAAVRGLGGVPMRGAGGPPTVAGLAEALAGTTGDVVVLPNDMESLEIATHVVGGLRGGGRRIAVVPTVAQVQGLAALAVHEPTADFDAAVLAMTSAAGHTRHGAVTIAEGSAMTMAGRCRPGDVLGLVEGDAVEIGSSVVEVGSRVIQRLLATGGELLTLVGGADAEPGLLAELERRTLELAGERAGECAGQLAGRVDVETLDGGQQRYRVLIGVE